MSAVRLMQMWGMARYELLIQWRRGNLRLLMVIFSLIPILVVLLLASVKSSLEVSQTQWSVAYSAEFRLTAMAIFVLLPLAALVFVGIPLLLAETIPLDTQMRMRDVFDSLPLPLWTYLMGKVLGVWLGLLLSMLVCIPALGLVIYLQLGAFNVRVWLQVWALVIVPSTLFSAGLSVLLAAGQPTRRRAVLVNFLLIPIFVYLYSISPFMLAVILPAVAPEQTFILDDSGAIVALRSLDGSMLMISLVIAVMVLGAAALLAWRWLRSARA